MPTIACPNCHKNLNAPDNWRGRFANCPACRETFLIEFETKQPVGSQSVSVPSLEPSPPERPEKEEFKACPLCGEKILAVAIKCKHCGSMLTPRSFLKAHGENRGTTSEFNDRWIWVLLMPVAGAVAGLLVSQYHPVFGGLAVIGEPWSPARQSLIGVHVLAFGGLGALISGASYIWTRPRRENSCRKGTMNRRVESFSNSLLLLFLTMLWPPLGFLFLFDLAVSFVRLFRPNRPPPTRLDFAPT